MKELIEEPSEVGDLTVVPISQHFGERCSCCCAIRGPVFCSESGQLDDSGSTVGSVGGECYVAGIDERLDLAADLREVDVESFGDHLHPTGPVPVELFENGKGQRGKEHLRPLGVVALELSARLSAPDPEEALVEEVERSLPIGLLGRRGHEARAYRRQCWSLRSKPRSHIVAVDQRDEARPHAHPNL